SLACAAAAMSAVLWWLDVFQKIDPEQVRWGAMIGIVLGLIAGFFALVVYAILGFLLVILFTELLILPAILLLALAAGREIWRLAGLAEVECEPVPSGMSATVETLEFGPADRDEFRQRGTLRHSLHELSAARRRGAGLIIEWTAPRGDPIRDLREGGRVRELLFDIWEMKYRNRLESGGAQALAAFEELHAIVRQAASEVGDQAFRDRFIPLLPKHEESEIEMKLLMLDAARIARRTASSRA